MPPTRRLFLQAAAAATTSILLPSLSGAANQGPGPLLYAIPLLGDIHYDRLSHHDLDWLKKEKGNDLRQIEGYVANTRDRTPRLLARVRETINAAKAPVPFVIQVGDFVEGLCGSQDLATLQMKDATAAVEAANLGAPVLLAKGNHDITGPGAPQAFDQTLLPWLNTQTKLKDQSANYTMHHAEDRFIFFDAYKPDLDWLDRTLTSEKSKRTFFIIHPPVVPYNARSNWHIFANSKDPKPRQRLLALLAQHRAFILSGHLHKYAIVARKVDNIGSFTQLAVSSVLTTDTPKPKSELATPDHYTPAELLATEPNFSPETRDKREQLIREESPTIKRYEYADLPGFAMLHIHQNTTEVLLYAGLHNQPWRTRELTSA